MNTNANYDKTNRNMHTNNRNMDTKCANTNMRNMNTYTNTKKFEWAQIPLRQLCDKVRDKFPTKSRTQIMSPTFMICVVDFRDLCLWQSPWTLLPTLSPTFPVHCNGLNSIRATQTGLSRTCHGLCRKHLDMSRWFVSATFVICVGDFHQNFMVSWFVTVCVCDFHDLCPRLSPRRSFGESWRNGIWVIGMWVQ